MAFSTIQTLQGCPWGKEAGLEPENLKIVKRKIECQARGMFSRRLCGGKWASLDKGQGGSKKKKGISAKSGVFGSPLRLSCRLMAEKENLLSVTSAAKWFLERKAMESMIKSDLPSRQVQTLQAITF
jgi:hypothetical protein